MVLMLVNIEIWVHEVIVDSRCTSSSDDSLFCDTLLRCIGSFALIWGKNFSINLWEPNPIADITAHVNSAHRYPAPG